MTTEEATIDTTEAQERLDKILSRERALPISAGFPTQPTEPKLPSISDPDPVREAAQDRLIDKQRKKRSDAGIPKRPPADPDEITLKLSIDAARQVALACSTSIFTKHLAQEIQDQIIAHLQKRLDALTKQK